MTDNRVSVALKGGLANQQFMACTVLAYAKETGRDAIFPLQTDQGCSRTKSYTDTIFRNLPRANVFPLKNTQDEKWAIYRENGYPYHPIPKNVSPSINILLDGYFQSWKYFDNYRSYLKKTFSPREEDIKVVEKYVEEKRTDSPVENLSIHVRRGDYTALPDIHYNQSITYYEKAFKVIRDKSSKSIEKRFAVFVFSDDLEWCKRQTFFTNLSKNHTVTFVDEEDYICLYVMQKCNNHIIANSSFSWMGAYFRDSADQNFEGEKGIVVCPKMWFGFKGPAFKMEDIALEDWIVI